MFSLREFDNSILRLVAVGFVLGIIIALTCWGGYSLITHYKIKIEKRPTPITMVITNTVTNVVYLPTTNK